MSQESVPSPENSLREKILEVLAFLNESYTSFPTVNEIKKHLEANGIETNGLEIKMGSINKESLTNIDDEEFESRNQNVTISKDGVEIASYLFA